MSKELFAIVLTFDEKINKKLLKSWKILKNKFNIKYISSKSPIPHLTLKSGYTNNFLKLKKRFEKKKFRKFKINSLGIGIFANKCPLIYIRWEQSKKLLSLYNSVERLTSKIFIKDSYSSVFSRWVPKTTIAYKDFKYKDLAKVLRELNFISLLKNAQVKQIKILKINNYGENIICSYKLL